MKQILVIAFLILSISISAQDIHFSQWDRNPLFVSPAATGVFNGDIRLNASYKGQWMSVPVPYQTVHLSADARVLGKPGYTSRGVLNIGGSLAYDRAGDSQMSLLQMTGFVGSIAPLSKRMYISAGAGFTLSQRSFSPEDLTFDSQFNGDIFNGALPINETFTNTSFLYFSQSAGFELGYVLSNKIIVQAGVSVFHINQPKQTFFEAEEIRLFRKLNGYLKSGFRLSEKTQLRAHLYFSKQGPHQEIVPIVDFGYVLTKKRGQDVTLFVGASTRLGDAAVARLGTTWGPWDIGLSYDFTISNLQPASSFRGGPEVAVQYIITKIPDPKLIKACPLF